MLAYCITMRGLEPSEAAFKRARASCAAFGLCLVRWEAITPKDNPRAMMSHLGIPEAGFHNKYSNAESCMSAFLSHRSLWLHSIERQRPILVLEHDAVMVAPLPELREGVINLGMPSFGKFKTPPEGLGKLYSRAFFGGAHAYVVYPEPAKQLIEAAKELAGPTDVFLHRRNFNFLLEYYPWPFHCEDSFTTIQKERGCLTKPGWGSCYRIIQ